MVNSTCKSCVRRGTRACMFPESAASDTLLSCSVHEPKEIDPHQPGAKLDQDKDRWDLLMDFAPFAYSLFEEKSEIQKIDLFHFVPWMIFGKIDETQIAQYCRFSHVVKVATYGAKKYTDGGWLSVPNRIRRYRAAAIRHRIAMETEECDSESGLPHAWHVEWNLWAVYTLEEKHSTKQRQ